MVRNQLDSLLMLPTALVVMALWAKEIRSYQVEPTRFGVVWMALKMPLWLIGVYAGSLIADFTLNPDACVEGCFSPSSAGGFAYGVTYSLFAFTVFGLLATFGMHRSTAWTRQPPALLVLGLVPVFLMAGLVGGAISWLAGMYLVAPVSFAIGEWLHFPSCRNPDVLVGPYAALPSVLLIAAAAIALVPPLRRLALRNARFVAPVLWLVAVIAGAGVLQMEAGDPWLCR